MLRSATCAATTRLAPRDADVLDVTAALVEIADHRAEELVVDRDLDRHDRLEP